MLVGLWNPHKSGDNVDSIGRSCQPLNCACHRLPSDILGRRDVNDKSGTDLV